MGPTFFLRRKKKPLLIPEPRQRVRLRARRGGRWRGSFRAVSEPYTDEAGEVVIRVAKEMEYHNAIKEGRRAMSMPWPVRQMAVILPSVGADEETGELPTARQCCWKLPQSAAPSDPRPRPPTGGAQEGAKPRSWWRRVFGG